MATGLDVGGGLLGQRLGMRDDRCAQQQCKQQRMCSSLCAHAPSSLSHYRRLTDLDGGMIAFHRLKNNSLH
ncbi:MAG: hypothetical protein RBS46_08865 [Methyloversatilis sp.]|jgi:hypothetical protein|nr:hypothetical protein [Methyloversatilis sp.]